MFLIQILLPLANNRGEAFAGETYESIEDELTERFGGITAYNRSPAEGRWRQGGREQQDDVVILEVMTDALDHDWWWGFRGRLERIFEQDSIVVRAQEIQLL
jgi:hypothetical protein